MFSERLDALLRKNHIRNNWLSEKLLDDYGYEISKESIGKYRNGHRTPEPLFIELVLKITKTTDANVLFRDDYTPTEAINSDIVLINKFDMRAGAGSGGAIDVPLENNKIAVDIKLLDRGLDPKYLRIIEVIGDSMQPDYDEGDFALIDMVCGRYFVKVAGTYVVRVEDVIYIKDVEFLPQNRARLISTNKKYGDMYPHEEGYECEIIGKVCGKIRIEKGLALNHQGIK